MAKKQFTVSDRASAPPTLSLSDLPASDTVRWVASRKATVVKAVGAGLLSLEEVCKRYDLSEEEFQSWHHAFNQNGPSALKVNRIQKYRSKL